MRSKEARDQRPARTLRAAPGWGRAVIYTVGHSTRSLAELVSMLRSADIQALADIRILPRSRANPQFNAKHLATVLPKQGIAYFHLDRLGGHRRPVKGSALNAAWRNASFRGYADYMQTEAFRLGIEELGKLARRGPVAAMCAEGNPWRCHRNLLADALLVRGADVRELSAAGRWKSHELIPFARVQGRKVSYPPAS